MSCQCQSKISQQCQSIHDTMLDNGYLNKYTWVKGACHTKFAISSCVFKKMLCVLLCYVLGTKWCDISPFREKIIRILSIQLGYNLNLLLDKKY